MGGGSISTSETKIEALKLQSSAYGVTIPVVGGVNRVAGNLVWYGGFKATPQTTTTRTGKGGGIKTTNTTYSYSASVVMGICHGPIGAIARVWRGKDVHEGGWLSSQVISAQQAYTPPVSGTMVVALTFGATIIGSASIEYLETRTVYPLGDGDSWEVTEPVYLALGSDYMVVGGTVTVLAERVRGKALTIRYQYGSGSPDLTPLVSLGISLARGDMGQPAPPWLSTAFASQALGYPGLAYVHAQDYSLGSGAQVENHSFEVQGSGAYRYGAASPDCNPAEFSLGVLCDGRWGARMRAEAVEASRWISYCAAANLLMSPVLAEQMRASEFIERMCALTNTSPVWSFDRLRLVPNADSPVTGNGITYTPDTTPLYDIDDDCWLADGADDPLQWSRKQPSDRHNHVKIEYSDRANYYAKAIAEATDDADIAINGRRTRPETIVAPWICDAAVARQVAQLAMQRALHISGNGRLRLPWAYSLLECADIITITDSALKFSKLPVRITSIGESEDGELEIEVEEWPLGVASPARYPSQAASGYLHQYNVAPGNAAAPVIFEGPATLSSSGLEVYIAAKGQSAHWGGCHVWVSLDGLNYRRVGTLYGGSRMGTLAAAVSSTLQVQGLGTAQLLSGSAADAAALQTLLYIDGASPEYLAYETATLTGAGAYTMAGLVRGAYDTLSVAHSTGDAVVRVDEQVARSGAIDLDHIGRMLQVKLTSFNVYGGAEQSLADVSATPYLIRGRFATGRVTAEANFAAWRVWDFRATLEGWVTVGATLTAGTEAATLTSSSTDPQLGTPTLGIPGSGSPRIRMRLRRLAGQGWQGDAYYTTPGHAPSESYKVSVPGNVGTAWTIIEWDMGQLADWMASTINAVRFDLGTSSADVFEIDWVAFGAMSPGSYGAIWGVNVAGSAAVDAAIAAAVASIDGIVSDGVLGRDEKPGEIGKWQELEVSHVALITRADAMGITTEKTAYESAITNLANYLNGLDPYWVDVSVNTPIVRTTYRNFWVNTLGARAALMLKIDQEAARRAEWASVSNVSVTTPQIAANAATEVIVQQNGDTEFTANLHSFVVPGINYVIPEPGVYELTYTVTAELVSVQTDGYIDLQLLISGAQAPTVIPGDQQPRWNFLYSQGNGYKWAITHRAVAVVTSTDLQILTARWRLAPSGAGQIKLSNHVFTIVRIKR